jgi:hypothetical protein
MSYHTRTPAARRGIGEVISREDRTLLARVWTGEARPTALGAEDRRKLADLFRALGDLCPAGSAQHEFQYARAAYLLGDGPNPGPSVNQFGAAHGCPKAYKVGPRRPGVWSLGKTSAAWTLSRSHPDGGGGDDN